MTGRPLSAFVALAVVTTLSCATGMTRMQRGLEPTMERMTRANSYLQVVAAISSDPGRISRADGHVYLADVAPQLRYMALTGDTAAYRRLRHFVETSMVRRDGGMAELRGRYRAGAAFEPASHYGTLRMGDALSLGWGTLGDTAAGMLAAQLRPAAGGVGAADVTQRLERCASLDAGAATDRGAARALLAREAKELTGGFGESQAAAVGLTGSDADLVLMSCLTRVAVAADDPDATVRHLEHILDRVDRMYKGSGRPNPGASSEVLLTFRVVQRVGPRY